MIGGMLVLIAALLGNPTDTVSAQDPAPPSLMINSDVGVPVFPYDLEDRPYRVLGEIKVSTNSTGRLFAKEASQEKIYRDLWKRAQAMGADAVINARYGDSHVSAFSFGKTKATGTAIKFLAPGEPVPGK